jgi:hypothetical protein
MIPPKVAETCWRSLFYSMGNNVIAALENYKAGRGINDAYSYPPQGGGA